MPRDPRGVLNQIDPVDGNEYVCAFASSALAPAMRNNPTIWLEPLAFILFLSMFYEVLEGIEYVWCTDAKAHEYITDNRYSANLVLNRYPTSLQAFHFRVEWVPGLHIVTDTCSWIVRS